MPLSGAAFRKLLHAWKWRKRKQQSPKDIVLAARSFCCPLSQGTPAAAESSPPHDQTRATSWRCNRSEVRARITLGRRRGRRHLHSRTPRTPGTAHPTTISFSTAPPRHPPRLVPIPSALTPQSLAHPALSPTTLDLQPTFGPSRANPSPTLPPARPTGPCPPPPHILPPRHPRRRAPTGTKPLTLADATSHHAATTGGHHRHHAALTVGHHSGIRVAII